MTIGREFGTGGRKNVTGLEPKEVARFIAECVERKMK